MEMILINFEPIRENVRKFLKDDKKAGVKKAWYFQHIEANQTQAMDSKKEFDDMVKVYENQGINHYKIQPVSKYATRMAGAKSVKLHVFRADDTMILQRARNTDGSFVCDNVGITFDYLPADCETCIAEVIY